MAVRAATSQVLQSLSIDTGAGSEDLRHTPFHDCQSLPEATVKTACQGPR
jgi:predicted nucleic acid binding AN1-type Zn finger protein